MPQVTGGAGGGDEEERRKRRHPGPPDREGDYSPGVPDGTVYTNEPKKAVPVDEPPSYINVRSLKDNTASRLAYLDSKKFMPTEVTWAIGNSSLSNADVSKAAKYFAKYLDLPVGDYFQQVSPTGQRADFLRAHGVPIIAYKDPITGGPLSLRSARRLLEQVEPQIIEQWLTGNPRTSNNARQEDVRQTSGPVSAKSVIRHLNTLTPLVGEDLNFGEALAVARSLAVEHSGKHFGKNLEVLLRGAMANDPKLAIATAAEASAAGVEFNNFIDVTAFLSGTNRATVLASEWEQNNGVPMSNSDQLQLADDSTVMVGSVGELRVINHLYDAIRNRETSYSEEAAQIMAEMNNPVDDRYIGQKIADGILTGLDIVNRPLDAFMRYAGDPDAVLAPTLEVRDGQSAIAWAGEDMKDILIGDASIYDLPRMKELGWDTGEIIFWEMAVSIGLPAGTAANYFADAKTLAEAGEITRAVSVGRRLTSGLLYTGEFLMDPLTTVGKGLKVAGGRRFLPALSHAAQGRAVTKLLTDTHKVLGGIDIPTYLDRAAQAATNPNDYFRQAVSRFRSSFKTDGLDPLTARAIFSWSQRAAANGVDEATRVRGIRNFIAESLGVPTGDKLAQEIAGTVEAAQRATLTQATDLRSLVSNASKVQAARRNGQALADQLTRFDEEIALTGPRMHEIPTVGATRGIISTGDSKFARAMRGLGVAELPLRKGNYFHFLPDLDATVAVDGLETVMVRSRVFSQEEIAAFRQEFTTAARPGYASREAAMGKVIAKVNDEMLGRLAKELGVTADDLDTFVTDVFGMGSGLKAKFARKLGFDPDSVYAVTVKGGMETQSKVPIQVAQLRNDFSMLDPVRVRKAAKESMGYIREADSIVRRIMGKPASKYLDDFERLTGEVSDLTRKLKRATDPDIIKLKGATDPDIIKGLKRDLAQARKDLEGLRVRKAKTVTPSRVVGEISRDVWRPFIGLVKFGWVARPAYILRIVAGDEMLRWMSTEGLMNRLRAGNQIGKLMSKFSLSEDEIIDIANRTGLSVEEARRMRYTGLLDPDAQASQGAVKFAANAQGDILPPEIQNAMIDHWGAVYRGQRGVTDDQFLSSWFRALYQFQQDTGIGHEVLLARAAGQGEEDAITRVRNWLNNTPEGRAHYNRMKQEPGWDVDEGTRMAVEYGYALTNEPRLAQLILDGGLSADALKQVDESLWPAVVHGPAMHSWQRVPVLSRIGRKWGELMLEMPTNRLIRQPYFKHHYATMYTFLREQAIRNGRVLDSDTVKVEPKIIPGRTGPATPDLLGNEPAAVARATTGDAEGYVYHVSPKENFSSIYDQGVLPTPASGGYLPKGMVPDEMRQDRAFWADSQERASELAWRGDENVAFRAKADDIGDSVPESLFSGSQYIHNITDPSKLEFLGADGVWHPLADGIGQRAGDIPFELDHALQSEAKKFAINRTQSVMFDFTRSGRIAEMLWFVNPFIQPFTEFFVAWPRIIKKNPALIGYANRLGFAAAESGFFQEDPQTGEQVIPASGFAAAAPILHFLTGNQIVGGGSAQGVDFSLSMNLAGFNMFTNSVFPVTVGGVTLPIPTPSFSPPAQWALQQFVEKAPIDEELKTKYMAWLTEYGEVSAARPQDWALPTWLRHALTGAVPSWFQAETDRNKNRFLAVAQAQALANGEEWTYDDEADATAQWQAQQFSLAKGFFSAIFPAAPKYSFETAEDEAAWQATIDAHDGDVNAAWEDFVGVWNPATGSYEGGTHPGLTLVATGKTMWADEDNPFPMPANALADRILSTEGGKQFAKEFPRWAFFIIPQEIRAGEVDMGVLNAQIARGQRKYRTPSQFVESADMNSAWSAAFAVNEQWVAWQQAHPDQSSGDPGYDAAQQQKERNLDLIAGEFPVWAPYRAQMTISTGVDPQVMTEARVLANTPEFSTKTDLGRGLHEYFFGFSGRGGMSGRDELERDMQAAGVSNLNTVAAEDLGFVKRRDDLVAAISERHPDFALAYDRFGFDMDLTEVVSKGDKAVDAVFKEPVVGGPGSRQQMTGRQWYEDVLNPWQDRWEKVQDAPYDETKIITDDQRFAAYDRMRAYANTAYEFDSRHNPLKLWWGKQNPNEKRDYLAGLSGRSATYWSRFDWELMGGKPTASTQKFWDEVNAARSEAFQRNNTDPDFGLGDALDRIDAAVNKYAKTHPKIAEQVKIANQWSYGLNKMVFDPVDGAGPIATPNTEQDWRDVLDASDTIREFNNQGDSDGPYFGPSDSDPKIAVYNKEIKKALGDYIEQKKKENPTFARQWAYVQELYGTDNIINILFPNEFSAYYPIGKVGD